ncbi:hypothetical protein HOLleu_39198 [Holothuria leucospilota]|uniref:Ig-like domain-containing protein n=1 Tax=Holothuria leucospilota TaxID=206669 RepID=A0A9Q1BBL5_HOLLE|nr:hypothetical protein HOLleu_39198 [Holothuria leucospilota]
MEALLHIRTVFLLLFLRVSLNGAAGVTISFTGRNVYSVPFFDTDGFIKKSFLTYKGLSSEVTLRCETPPNSGPVSIFKGPWSNPSLLVDRGTPVIMDPNLSFSELVPSGYEIAIDTITSENAGTYYCFSSESVSDREFTERSSFVELFVEEDRTALFCLMHSYTDSIFFSDVDDAVLQCIANIDDLRESLISVYQRDDETQETSEIDSSLSFPVQSMFVEFFQAAVIIYEIPGDAGTDILSFNNSVLICERSPDSGLCGNVEPLKIFTDLKVLLDLANFDMEADEKSLKFVCRTFPNVVATNLTWTVSEQVYSTSRVSQTSDGSELVLENIDLDKISGKDFNVSCSVTIGGRETITQETRLQVDESNGMVIVGGEIVTQKNTVQPGGGNGEEVTVGESNGMVTVGGGETVTQKNTVQQGGGNGEEENIAPHLRTSSFISISIVLTNFLLLFY